MYKFLLSNKTFFLFLVLYFKLSKTRLIISNTLFKYSAFILFLTFNDLTSYFSRFNSHAMYFNHSFLSIFTIINLSDLSSKNFNIFYNNYILFMKSIHFFSVHGYAQLFLLLIIFYKDIIISNYYNISFIL